MKETSNVISTGPPCQDGNVRFTTVPLIKNAEDNVVLVTWKVFNSDHFYIASNMQEKTSHFSRESKKRFNNRGILYRLAKTKLLRESL